MKDESQVAERLVIVRDRLRRTTDEFEKTECRIEIGTLEWVLRNGTI